MKSSLILWPLLCLLSLMESSAQNVKRQTDKHIVHQQERMVFKHWDHFSPFPRRFLGMPTNPLWYMTWAWHPDYPRTDRRPLSAIGPQTQRMALVLAMQHTDNQYKLHADTLAGTAVTEAANYSGLVTGADPLWVLYYKKEFRDLLETDDSQLMSGLDGKVRSYLRDNGLLEWYLEERSELRERLEAARSATLDRGSRILAYHRMLGEHRRLLAMWEAKKSRASLFIALAESREGLRVDNVAFPEFRGGRTDLEIADGILERAYQ